MSAAESGLQFYKIPGNSLQVEDREPPGILSGAYLTTVP